MPTVHLSGPLCHVTERPTTSAYRQLPAGLALDQAELVPVSDIRAGDVLVGVFPDCDYPYQPVKVEHLQEPFAVSPRPVKKCGCTGCDECRWGGWSDNAVCLRSSHERDVCHLAMRSDRALIIRAEVAARYPSFDSTPPPYSLLTIEDTSLGPYRALPVGPHTGPFDPVSLSQETAARLASDVNASAEMSDICGYWKDDWLVFDWTASYRRRLYDYDPTAGRLIVEPDHEGRYRVGALWQWREVEQERPH
ncbi:hypothetical protein [Streptomyces smyrnaeus]|uniref:hypothetical protein n=1 Tax=Streptomyces smyrnaeus TaxID=1387713 RepID=UPI000C19444B